MLLSQSTSASSQNQSQDLEQEDEQNRPNPSLVAKLTDPTQRRLGIHLLLYKYDQPAKTTLDPLHSPWERLYVVGWWSIFSTSTFYAYFFSHKQHPSLSSQILYWVIVVAVAVAMASPSSKKKKPREWILRNVLKLNPSKRYGDDGLKMWLLMPLVFLGIWAPWAPGCPRWAWIGTILPMLCITVGLTILGFDVFHMIHVTNSKDFNKYFWVLLFDTCEILTYIVAVIIFNQRHTVKKLFQFDHTDTSPELRVGGDSIEQSEAGGTIDSTISVSLAPLVDSGGNGGSDSGDTGNEPTERKTSESEIHDDAQSPFSHYCQCDLSEADDEIEEELLSKIIGHDEISNKMVETAWKWVVWFLSPALMYCYVAYVSSVLFDAQSNNWRRLFPKNRWLPWVYDVSPFGGTNFSVGSGYVSGVLLVMAGHVWFVCLTVSMELNRIAIQRAEGRLDTAKLYALIQVARNRLNGLVNKFKYIIAIQFVYSVALLGLIFVHVFRIFPPSIAILNVNGWTGVSAFVLVFQFVVTAYYASGIRKQWDLIVDVVVAQQQEHLRDPEHLPDFAPIYDHLKLSPFGIKIFGFQLNMTFVKTLAVGVLTQVAGFAWAWVTEFLKRA